MCSPMSMNTWSASAIKASTAPTQVNNLSLRKSFTPQLPIPSQSPRSSKLPPYLSAIYTRLGRVSTKALKPMVFQWQLIEVGVHSQMKLYLDIITLVAVAAFIPVIAGLTCDSSSCAACFKDSNSNVRVKFSCPNGHCADVCPTGYQGIKCSGIEGCK